MKSPWISAMLSVALTVPDLAAAEDFYTRVWQLTVAARTDTAICLRSRRARMNGYSRCSSSMRRIRSNSAGRVGRGRQTTALRLMLNHWA